MKKMGKSLLLAAGTGLISMAAFSCRTPDTHDDHPTGEHPAAGSEHPTEHDAEHPTEHPTEHPKEDK